MASKCSNCGGENLYRTEGVSARGGYGPNLLPGLGAFWSGARFDVTVCADCGLTQFHADERTRATLPFSRRWRRV
jgi:predicted nucleic-acid-binding Zn-ribbon protein